MLPSESQPSEKPKRSQSKGKKDMSKFARKTVIVPTETSNRHYVSVCELRQNVVVTWPVRVRSGKHVEPFTKFLKDYVLRGLADRQEDVDTPERKFVEALNIVMICPRRGADGSYLPQSDDKNYPWMQYVHIVPDACATKPARERMQTVMTKKLNKLAAKTTWPAIYDKGKDLSDSNELGVVNSKLLDEDTAELVQHQHGEGVARFL